MHAVQLAPGLSEERVQAVREQLDERLKAASDGSLAASCEGALWSSGYISGYT